MSQTAEEWEYKLRKYLLLLATVVATMTYSAGFNPPGGVWQEASAGHLAGDPIIRDIHYIRYAFFFYSNGIAFASSLVVTVIILILTLIEGKYQDGNLSIKLVWVLRVVMVFDLISLMTAHTAGACRDNFTKLYSSLLLAASIAAYLVLQVVLAIPKAQDSNSTVNEGNTEELKKGRKVLMLLATFAVSLTYYAGLNTPGGFWDKAEDGHRPGDAILTEHHSTRFRAFFVCNNTAFAASIFTIALLLDKKLHKAGLVFYLLNGCIVVALISLVGAYAAGGSRHTGPTTYALCLGLAILVKLSIAYHCCCPSENEKQIGTHHNCKDEKQSESDEQIETHHKRDESTSCWSYLTPKNATDKADLSALDKARSLVLLLATLVATITYQAGLDPPGGVWQESGDGHVAGDPVLQTTNPRRYKVFFYCNSVAFVASLVAIVFVQRKLLLKHHVLEAVVLLDMFGLIGAYAAGSCRDTSSSMYVIAMVGVVMVYVVIHVIFFTLDHKKHDEQQEKSSNEQLEKRRKNLLLFAILAATISYQAGLTPPGGFLLRNEETTGHHIGDPILLYNSTSRFKAFFYCNSASFMLSMALILLMVNPNIYRPAIRSYALSVCTAAVLFGLVGAYAVGSTQRRSTSISIIIIASVLLFVLFLLLLVLLSYDLGKISTKEPEVTTSDHNLSPATAIPTSGSSGETGAQHGSTGQGEDEKKKNKKNNHAKRKYLMLLGILVASVTYQAGLDQPGGMWQSTADGHFAGNPVMQDLRGRRYQAFFYCNSTAFVASVVVIVLLLPRFKQMENWWLRVMNTTVLLELVLLLGAYAVGTTRDRKTSARVAALIAAVLAYSLVHVIISHLCSLASSIKKGRTAAVGTAENDNQNP